MGQISPPRVRIPLRQTKHLAERREDEHFGLTGRFGWRLYDMPLQITGPASILPLLATHSPVSSLFLQKIAIEDILEEPADAKSLSHPTLKRTTSLTGLVVQCSSCLCLFCLFCPRIGVRLVFATCTVAIFTFSSNLCTVSV